MTRVHLTADGVTVETSGDDLTTAVTLALLAWDRTRPPTPRTPTPPQPAGFTAADVLHTTPPHLERAPYVDDPEGLDL